MATTRRNNSLSVHSRAQIWAVLKQNKTAIILLEDGLSYFVDEYDIYYLQQEVLLNGLMKTEDGLNYLSSEDNINYIQQTIN